MVFKDYTLEHVPTAKDDNRYKLNIVGDEKDINVLVKKLGKIASKPFPSPNENFDWSLYLYELNDKLRDRITSELDRILNRKDQPKEDEKPGEEEKTEEKPVLEEEKVEPEKPESKENRPEEEKEDEAEPPAAEKEEAKTDGKPEEKKSGNGVYMDLNEKYTFDNFVVGANTRFTYAACKAVAEKPGKNYNPLFIYGGVGLGKTHLMQAIGTFVKEQYPEFTIAYVTTDNFVNEVVEAIEKGKVNSLRMKYKQIDLLLIDDIQFLEQSESTQEEFFHIFNAMHAVGKQIVITSDKPPKQLSTLEDRLKSRFEWGLTTDIKSPNIETRRAIIKRKAEQAGIEISEEITSYISERLTDNIRELEGIINRIAAYLELSNDQIELDFVKDIIDNNLPKDQDEDEAEEEKPKKKKKARKEEPEEEEEAPAPASVRQPGMQQPYAPPVMPPYPAPHQMGNICARCGGQLTFLPQYQKYFCTGCGMYTDPMQPFMPAGYPPVRPYAPQPPGMHPPVEDIRRCMKCGNPLEYIQKYNRYYCRNCAEYAPVEKINKFDDEPPPPPDEKKAAAAKKAPVKPIGKIKPLEKKEDKKAKPVDENFETKVIGEEKEELREIRTGYLLPEGSESITAKIVDRLGKLATQKRFNFYVKPLFVHYYSPKMINYEKIAHMSTTNNIDIAMCMEPGKDSEVDIKEFRDNISKAMDKASMPFEILSQGDIKDSDALNLMLDIAICAKKGK
ncbi:MAG: chromosomal replication initiator protein DnaA [Elusimicrobia bacterium]|nr:chromosomal replication initiator protein DnaA [Elusimicrobiota bacterium]